MKTWRDECGVFGVWNCPEASRLAYLGLYAIQHRGQESAGIVSLNNEKHITHRGMGLVADVFNESKLDLLKGESAIGHVRYSTTGENQLLNAQPLTATLFNGPLAIAHNGNIVNADILRDELKKKGAIFQGTNDTEVILHLLANDLSDDLIECLQGSLIKVKGAYSFALLSDNCLIAGRDSLGMRPLCLGKIIQENREITYVVSSESCSFDLIGAEYVREIEPGEILKISNEGLKSFKFNQNQETKTAQCVFEHVYFSRPDSFVFGKSVYQSRKNFGKWLAKQSAVDADMVVPVPDSGVASAIGYSEESKIPFEFGIIRNHYVGRTFIEPKQSIRSFGVKIKLNPQAHVLKGKKVIIVDDSIVRGTTSKKIIELVRAAGASEVHVRIAAPPTKGPCYYGVDTPDANQLIANRMSVDEIKEYIGADSLSYLTMDGLAEALSYTYEGFKKSFCGACFDLDYPTKLYGEANTSINKISQSLSKEQLRKKNKDPLPN